MIALSRNVLSIVLMAAATMAGAQQADLMNRADPLPGVTTAGQPDQAALKDLADAGYVAVIDLRGVGEDRGFDEQAAVEALGMSYLPLPVAGANDVNYENAAALDRLLSELDGPVLVHCASSNRVGALLSLRHRMNGGTRAEALELGNAAGLSSLRPAVEKKLDER